MENGSSGLSASDVLALTRDNNNGFLSGNAGGILALIIVFILIFGNGNLGGNNNATTLGIADLQASLYNQTQDANSRSLAAGQAAITDAVITNGYNNLSQMKDMQYQVSNSIAALSNQMSTQHSQIMSAFQEQEINRLRDALSTTRDELSNQTQTQAITDAITAQTSQILNAQGTYYMNPPCYGNCGCGCSSLY